jgi:sigma-B regulation protein RsbQ
MDILQRHHVQITGSGPLTLVLAHGFGCDQAMWRHLLPWLEPRYRVVRFDHAGCGRAVPAAYSAERHATLAGYAEDALQLLDALQSVHGMGPVVWVGHSVSSMIGALAAIRRPEYFRNLVMLGPSPRYLNDPPGYVGGFEPPDIAGLMDMLDTNLVGWARHLSQTVVGDTTDPQHRADLEASFCAADPAIVRRFAAATFLSDHRADLQHVRVPTLVVQMLHDAIAPLSVGEYCHRQLQGSTLEVMLVSGHCPHLTHPEQTFAVLQRYLGQAAPQALA